MVSVLKKFKVITWKCFMLRRRNWKLALLELVSPLLVAYLTYSFNAFVESEVGKGDITVFPPGDIFNMPMNSRQFVYTPSNNFTKEIMRNFINSLKMDNSGVADLITIESVDSQSDVESWLLAKSKKWYITLIAVEFLQIDVASKQFKYKIRTNHEDMKTDKKHDRLASMNKIYFRSSFLGTQTRLDFQLLKSAGLVLQEKGRVLYGPLPEPNNVNLINLILLYFFMMLAYVFMVSSVLRDVIQEKATGIKELMKVMGVPTWMVWTQWLVYFLIVEIPVSIGMTVILSVLSPKVIPTNFFIVWLLFFLFTINCLFILFAISCLFNGPARGTTVCVTLWLVIHLLVLSYVLEPSTLSYIVQLLLSFIPLINLCWALYVIMSFSLNNLEWTLFGDLFSSGFAGQQISVGHSIIIFVVETILFLLLLMYLDAVKPGPYGVAKPINFVCLSLKRMWTTSNESNHMESYSRAPLPTNFERPPKEAKVGIKIRELRKEYGWFKKVVAVEEVSLDIYEGEIMALLGHNGAGKTTTMSMITGMFSPSKGVILVNNRDIKLELTRFRESLGYCPQHNIYFSKFTVIEHLIFFGMLKGMTYSEAKRVGLELLIHLKMGGKENTGASKLSGGMKRRLCLAVSLVGSPKVLILDEPTSGLDPENRRQVWNIILGMRGQRTILLTTHIMEEADVLGDRIAIMAHGRVVCCGTSMFLKAHFGTGYSLHILKEPDAPEDSIVNLIGKHIPRPNIKMSANTQIDISVKKDYVESFPTLLSALERQKDVLGISGISVACTTMEDVFLKVAEQSFEEKDAKKEPQELSQYSLASYPQRETSLERVEGCELVVRRVGTLLWKRRLYRLRNILSLVYKTVITCLLILYLIYSSHYSPNSESEQDPLTLSLSLYPGCVAPMVYDENNKDLANITTNIIKKNKGAVNVLEQGTNMTEYTTDLARSNPYDYQHITLMAITFLKEDITIQYQSELNVHIPAIAANLMSNILLQNLSEDRRGSIVVINHPFSPDKVGESECGDSGLYTLSTPMTWIILFTIAVIIIMSDFIPFLIEERVSGFKHQQIMAGVSPILYWLANFIFDFFVYICIIALWILIILASGMNLVHFGSVSMNLLILVLLLNGISGICFVYLFTYFINSTTLGNSVFFMFNLAFSLCAAFVLQLGVPYNFNTFLIVITLLGFNPTFSTTMAITSISKTIAFEHLCSICQDHNCQRNVTLLQMPTDNMRDGISLYLIFLAFSWFIYLAIILCMEYGCVRLISFMFFYKKGVFSRNADEDDDIKNESERVRIFKESGVVSIPLRVENLNKKYFFGPKAVQNVSFMVTRGECFGLLGVNGAGKTTTFKMIAGEILPNGGDAFVTKYSVISDRRKYMSCVGYCPQFDAFPGVLTGEEILIIMAKLRGLAEREVRDEVYNWLNKLGIREHAKKRSVKYSGGTKRKLNTAMAFVGDPEVVFLDEPTTGVDPLSRRKLWSAVQERQRAGQAIVLTSHSMEECEALCTRLTILSAGRMRCIGSTEYLKNKFTQGYTVLIKLVNPTENERLTLKRDFANSFQKCDIKDEHMSLIHYQVSDPRLPLSYLFSKMLSIKDSYNFVEDFTVSNTTLEQLFLSFSKM